MTSKGSFHSGMQLLPTGPSLPFALAYGSHWLCLGTSEPSGLEASLGGLQVSLPPSPRSASCGVGSGGFSDSNQVAGGGREVAVQPLWLCESSPSRRMGGSRTGARPGGRTRAGRSGSCGPACHVDGVLGRKGEDSRQAEATRGWLAVNRHVAPLLTSARCCE